MMYLLRLETSQYGSKVRQCSLTCRVCDFRGLCSGSSYKVSALSHNIEGYILVVSVILEVKVLKDVEIVVYVLKLYTVEVVVWSLVTVTG